MQSRLARSWKSVSHIHWKIDRISSFEAESPSKIDLGTMEERKQGFLSGTSADSDDHYNIGDGSQSLTPCAQLGAGGSAGLDIEFSRILRREQ